MPHTIHTPRPFTTNIVFYIALCMALCALYFMTGCGSGGSAATDPATATVYAARTPEVASDSMHVLDSTYQRLVSLFADNFNVDGGKQLLYTVQEVPYDSLLLLAPSGPGKHALHIDYGLFADSIRLAFSIVSLDTTSDPSVFTYTPRRTVYDWHRGRFTAFDRETWRGDYQMDSTNTKVYFSKVQVRHSASAAFGPVEAGSDAHADVLAWEDEVLALYQQNAGHPDSTFYTVFSCIGRLDAKELIRHGMVMHMRLRPTDNPEGHYRDLLDNTYNADSLLRNHGADFGSLCPPGYGVYDLPVQ